MLSSPKKLFLAVSNKVLHVIPCYKGKGKDPLIPTSYRGVTLLSVINKVLEKIILNRMRPFLEELGIPHRNQTAYQTNVSCTDAIFATHECVAYYLRHGNKVFACFYDLEKAFDSIEHSILLHHLYDAGIKGKCWRLI